jgi:hypothetical protein
MYWISLKDKEPPIGEYVLFLDNNRNDGYSFFVAYLDESGIINGPRDFGICERKEDCTHWMLLPNRPKSK